MFGKKEIEKRWLVVWCLCCLVGGLLLAETLPGDVWGGGGGKRWEGGEKYARRLFRSFEATGARHRRFAINMVLAPVLGVSPRDQRHYLSLMSRSFGNDPWRVGLLGALMVRGLERGAGGRLLCVAKHFPGLGSTVKDTHRRGVHLSLSLAQLKRRDLVPFRLALRAGVRAIMTSHAIVPAFHRGRRDCPPVTLSAPAIRYLRQTMGFRGIVVSDSLSDMHALRDYYLKKHPRLVSKGSARYRAFGRYFIGRIAVDALRAGNDLLILTVRDYKPEVTVERVLRAMRKAISQGKLSRQRLHEAVLRLLREKQRLGLLSSLRQRSGRHSTSAPASRPSSAGFAFPRPSLLKRRLARMSLQQKILQVLLVEVPHAVMRSFYQKYRVGGMLSQPGALRRFARTLPQEEIAPFLANNAEEAARAGSEKEGDFDYDADDIGRELDRHLQGTWPPSLLRRLLQRVLPAPSFSPKHLYPPSPGRPSTFPVKRPTTFPITLQTHLRTREQMAVYQVLRRYRTALQRCRWLDLLPLISKSYYDTRGTLQKSDDYGYRALRKRLRQLQRQKYCPYRLRFHIAEIYFSGASQVTVSLRNRGLYRVPRRQGKFVFQRFNRFVKMRMVKKKGRWLIQSGL